VSVVILELDHRAGVESGQLLLGEGFVGETRPQLGLRDRVFGQVPQGVLVTWFLIHKSLKVCTWIIT
jgi:hypothetical protein